MGRVPGAPKRGIFGRKPHENSYHVILKPDNGPRRKRVGRVPGAPKRGVFGRKPHKNSYHVLSGETWKLCAQWAKNPQNFLGGCMPLGYSRGQRVLREVLPGQGNCVVFSRFLWFHSTPNRFPDPLASSNNRTSASCLPWRDLVFAKFPMVLQCFACCIGLPERFWVFSRSVALSDAALTSVPFTHCV